MNARAALLALALAPAASADAQASTCGKDTPPALSEIAEAGVFMIGFREDAYPMSFADPEGSRAADGYSVDLCERVFEMVREEIEASCGIKIEVDYAGVSSKNRFGKLLRGEIDILCGTTSRTLARDREFDFTLPIFITGGVFASRDGARVRDFSDLAGKRLALLPQTTTETIVTQAISDRRIALAKPYEHVDSISDGLRRLRLPPADSAAIDVFATDQLPLLARLRDASDLHVSSRFFSFELYALAVRKDRRPIRVIADRVIADLYRTRKIEERYRREIERLFGAWFAELSEHDGVIPPGLDMLFRLNAIPEGAPFSR